MAVKAEYIAASAATREALFHRHLLHSLGFGDHMPIVFADNTGCVQVAKDPGMHSKLKHVDTIATTYRRVIFRYRFPSSS